MTERKNERRGAGNVPAPWVPSELPASTAAPGRSVAKRDRANALPAPWVPAELPASTPAQSKRDRAIAKSTPWVPPPSEAPRNLPAVPEERPAELQPDEYRPAAPAVAQNTAPVIQQTIIVQQVAAPVVYVPWMCGRWNCPLARGYPCRRFFCGWW
jgi:hypothetical protein